MKKLLLVILLLSGCALAQTTCVNCGGGVSGATQNNVQKGSATGSVQDSVGLSEVPFTFTVNENQTLNGTLAVTGGVTLAQLAAPSTLVAVQGASTGGFLLHNQAYFYKVTAISSVGETTVSNESTFTTAASPVGDTYTATLTWAAVTGATGYKVYRSTTTGNELLLATISAGNSNAYTDNTNATPSGAMPTTNTSAAITVTGPVTATQFSTSNSNSGLSSVEGTGAALTAGAGTDIMWADSTGHCFKVNLNNSAAGCLAVLGLAQVFASTVTATNLSTSAGTACSAPALFWATNYGLAYASGNVHLCSGGNSQAIWFSGGLRFVAADAVSWAASTDPTAAADTTISRENPGITRFGTTAANNAGTVDAATFQYRGLAQTAFVTGDFTTSGSGTALEAITGLTWTFPASTAINARIDCYLTYHQNGANVAVAFGFQDASVAPTNLMANALMSTSATAHTEGTIAASVATSATAIVSATPSAITTNWQVQLHFFIEQPSNAGTSIFTIRTSTATQADTVTVVRGSYCELAQ